MYPSWNFNERQPEILNIKVSKNALYRALRITDALIRAIETRGGEVEIRDRKTFCRMNNAEVEFSLWEKVARSERRLTEKELRESYVPDRWIFTPTGELVFRIDEIDIGRKNWKDKKDKPLEEQVNDVMIGLITASRIIRERDLQRERERQRVLEEQERRTELARLQQIAGSHKVISNLLTRLCKEAGNAKVKLSIVQKAKADGCEHDFVTQVKDNPDVLKKLQSGEAHVAAGTPWLWSRAEMAS